MTVLTVVMVVLAVIAIIIYYLAQSISGDTVYYDQDAYIAQQSSKNIKPVGHAVVAGSDAALLEAKLASAPVPTQATAVALTGEEIYNQACSACHATNIPTAPQQGDTAAWQERFDKAGLDGLIHNAINGLGTMMPRGGRADLSDENIKDAIIFMLDASGIKAE